MKAQNEIKKALLEQKTLRGQGCGTYGIEAQDIYNVCKNEFLQHSEADYFIRISVRSTSGILMHSKNGAKMKYFAVKNDEIYITEFFAPDSRYINRDTKNQWVWDINDYLCEEKNQKLADAIIESVAKGKKVTISHNNYDWEYRSEYDSEYQI